MSPVPTAIAPLAERGTCQVDADHHAAIVRETLPGSQPLNPARQQRGDSEVPVTATWGQRGRRTARAATWGQRGRRTARAGRGGQRGRGAAEETTGRAGGRRGAGSRTGGGRGRGMATEAS